MVLGRLAGVMNDNGKWGFIDKTGKVVIPYKWNNVQWFRNGEARVQMTWGDSKWLTIDRNGQYVV